MELLLRRGATGPVVAEVRARLSRLGFLPAQGGDQSIFDKQTDRAVRAFQQARGINVDGIVGAETFRQLEEARWRLGDRVIWYSAAHPHVGDDVLALQTQLTELGFFKARRDGIYGPKTDHALRDFQRNYGVTPDGTCGGHTLVALNRLAGAVRGGAPDRVWDVQEHTANRTGISDKVIVIDPGHGGPDTGCEGHGLTEALVAEDLARRVEGRLAAIGTQVVLTRPPASYMTSSLSDSKRARLANEAGGDLVISIHSDWTLGPKPHGVASYFFGTARSSSVLGELFADVLQRSITSRTDLIDCGVHAKNWDLLRLTQMAAVRVEVGYLSHSGDSSRLAQSRFRDRLAESIAAAAIEFFSPTAAASVSAAE